MSCKTARVLLLSCWPSVQRPCSTQKKTPTVAARRALSAHFGSCKTGRHRVLYEYAGSGNASTHLRRLRASRAAAPRSIAPSSFFLSRARARRPINATRDSRLRHAAKLAAKLAYDSLALHHGSTGLHPEAFFAYTCFPAGLRPTSTCAQRSSPVMRPLALVGILVVAGASALINPWLLPRLRASYYPLGPATVRVLPRLLRRRSSPPSQMRFLLMKSKRAGAQHLHHERLCNAPSYTRYVERQYNCIRHTRYVGIRPPAPGPEFRSSL